MSNNGTFSITNSSNLPLSVLSSFNNSDLETNALYENTLTLFLTVGDEFSVGAETAEVKLLANHCLSGEEQRPCFVYSLLFVTPHTLSPIDRSFISEKNGLYPPVTVTEQAFN